MKIENNNKHEHAKTQKRHRIQDQLTTELEFKIKFIKGDLAMPARSNMRYQISGKIETRSGCIRKSGNRRGEHGDACPSAMTEGGRWNAGIKGIEPIL
jgi:hypothetical protein